MEGCVDAGGGVGGLGGGAISCLVMALVLASAVLSCIGSLIIGGLCWNLVTFRAYAHLVENGLTLVLGDNLGGCIFLSTTGMGPVG